MYLSEAFENPAQEDHCKRIKLKLKVYTASKSMTDHNNADFGVISTLKGQNLQFKHRSV